MNILEQVKVWIAMYELEKLASHLNLNLQNPLQMDVFQPEVYTPGDGDARKIVPSKSVPSWNLMLYRQYGQELLPYQSAVLVSGFGARNRLAITTGHGLEQCAEYFALQGTNCLSSARVISHGLKANLVENLFDKDKEQDLAIFEIAGLESVEEDLGIQLSSTSALKDAMASACTSHGVVMGWGWIDPEIEELPTDLRYCVMELDKFDCDSRFLFSCLSFDERGPMMFDSGAPFVIIDEGQLKLAGIVKGFDENIADQNQTRHRNDAPARYLTAYDLLQNFKV